MKEAFSKIIERLEKKKIDLDALYCYYNEGFNVAIDYAIKMVNQVSEEFATDTNVGGKDGWIPFTQRVLTKEEKEEFVYDSDYILDCKLPDDDTEILVCSKNGYVYTDTFFNDCGECYLDSGNAFIDDAIAWQPLLPAYQPKGE